MASSWRRWSALKRPGRCREYADLPECRLHLLGWPDARKLSWRRFRAAGLVGRKGPLNRSDAMTASGSRERRVASFGLERFVDARMVRTPVLTPGK